MRPTLRLLFVVSLVALTGCPPIDVGVEPPCTTRTRCVDDCCNLVATVAGCGMGDCPRGTQVESTCTVAIGCCEPGELRLCASLCCETEAMVTCEGSCPLGLSYRASGVCAMDRSCSLPRDAGGPVPLDASVDAPTAFDAPCPGPDGSECRPIDDACCRTTSPVRVDPSTCEVYCTEEGHIAIEAGTCAPAPECAADHACDDNADCVVTHEGCCEPCSLPELSEVVALNQSRVDEYRASVCAEPVGCPECEPAGPNPRLVATCNVGVCEALDLYDALLVRCEDDSDCRLRVPGCCECGGDTDPATLISMRTDAEADYRALVCNEDMACDGCVPTYPETHEAFCNPERRCDIRTIPEPPPAD